MIYERGINHLLRANMDNDSIGVIIGARQTGKTTILRMLFAEAKETGRPAFFINLENLEFLSLFNQSPENLFKVVPRPSETGDMTVFIDEIQYLDHPTHFLKYLYDTYGKALKLVVSGSSSFYIDEKFTDSLAGRKRIFTLYPLSFQEFLVFNGRNDLGDLLPPTFHLDNFQRLQEMPLIYRDDLVRLFSGYARFGGYPRVVLAETEDEKKAVLEDLVHSGVKKDVLESGVKNPQKYYDLYKVLCFQAGSLVNRSELAKTIQLSLPAIERYLYVMQKSFHLVMIRSFHRNIRKEIIKLPKVYLFDLGIRNYLLGDFSDFALRVDKGPFLESLAFRQFLNRFPLDDIKFWRTQDKNELDFVIQDRLAFEVKATPESFSLSKYSNFMKKNPGIPVNVVTYDRVEDKGPYRIWPVWGV
jgi:hypothetical protein